MDRPWRRRPKPAHALSPPWYRRRALWAAGTAVSLVVVGMVASSGGDGERRPPAAVPSSPVSTPTTTTSTTAVPAACIEVANPSLLTTIDATAAAAVEVTDGWFVSKANGATWYTTAEPTRDAEGELLPMNDQARADSESRRDVPSGAAVYNGHTDADDEATASRACAAASPRGN